MLFLGKAEMLLSHSRIFAPLDLKRRHLPQDGHRARASRRSFAAHAFAHERRMDVGGIDALRERAFAASPVAQVVVTADDLVALVNQQAETSFGLSAKDIGRPLRDLDISYRPVELRGYVEQAQTGTQRRCASRTSNGCAGSATPCGSRCTSTRSPASTTACSGSRSSSTT